MEKKQQTNKKIPVALHKQSAPPHSIATAHQGSEGGSFLFVINLHLIICGGLWELWGGGEGGDAEEMWSVSGSMRLCLHLFVLVRLTLPSTTVSPSNRLSVERAPRPQQQQQQ